jgi:hypothetical protein
VYYVENVLGEGIIKEMPDGVRYLIEVPDGDEVILQTFARRGWALSSSLRAVNVNSSVLHVELIEISDGNIAFNGSDEANLTHGEIAESVGNALGITSDAAFKNGKAQQ